MRDMLYLGIVAVFAVVTWGLLVLFTKLLGGKK
jgi:hypothetical protein